MAAVRPFRCIRPGEGVAASVAALPYDVYNRQEASAAVEGRPLSFLNIDRAETQFPEDVDLYDARVYEKAKELLEQRIADKTFVEDVTECYYIYELTMDGRSQTGVVACCSIDDYLDGIIKKHENTREEKEQDRIRHIDTVNAQTGPVFLAYHADKEINKIVEFITGTKPIYNFQSEDGVRHRVWKIAAAALIENLKSAFEKISSIYIADGHHRAASAVKVGLKRRQEHPDGSGEEPYNYFLSVLFPGDQLMILPYNRVVTDLNGLSKAGFLDAISACFHVVKKGKKPFTPEKKGTFGLYLGGEWYSLTAADELKSKDPVKGLDVSILQDYLLSPVLGIRDPRTDKRIKFVGGIRGPEELERLVDEGMEAAFSMYPTTIKELFQVADAGLLMPPKSTWFEPKLRSGLFIHKLSPSVRLSFQEGDLHPAIPSPVGYEVSPYLRSVPAAKV